MKTLTPPLLCLWSERFSGDQRSQSSSRRPAPALQRSVTCRKPCVTYSNVEFRPAAAVWRENMCHCWQVATCTSEKIKLSPGSPDGGILSGTDAASRCSPKVTDTQLLYHDAYEGNSRISSINQANIFIVHSVYNSDNHENIIIRHQINFKRVEGFCTYSIYYIYMINRVGQNHRLCIKMENMTASKSEARASWSPPGGWLQYRS